MKKKCFALLIVLGILLSLVAGAVAYLHINSLWFSTGICMVTDSGSCLILLDGSPIVMSNHTGRENAFETLRTGDTLRILHDGIQETYPGGTGVYFVQVLERGGIEDVPEDILESLSPMGWHITDITGKTREIYTGTVESFDAVYGDEGNFLLKLYVDDFPEETMTFTVVTATEIDSPDGIQPGDTVQVKCIAETSGYREVLSLTENGS